MIHPVWWRTTTLTSSPTRILRRQFNLFDEHNVIRQTQQTQVVVAALTLTWSQIRATHLLHELQWITTTAFNNTRSMTAFLTSVSQNSDLCWERWMLLHGVTHLSAQRVTWNKQTKEWQKYLETGFVKVSFYWIWLRAVGTLDALTLKFD